MQNGGQSTLLTLHSTAQQFGHLMVESLFRLWSAVPSQGTTEYTRKTGDPGSRQDTGSWLATEFMLRQTPLLAMEIRLEVTLTGLSSSPLWAVIPRTENGIQTTTALLMTDAVQTPHGRSLRCLMKNGYKTCEYHSAFKVGTFRHVAMTRANLGDFMLRGINQS